MTLFKFSTIQHRFGAKIKNTRRVVLEFNFSFKCWFYKDKLNGDVSIMIPGIYFYVQSTSITTLIRSIKSDQN